MGIILLKIGFFFVAYLLGSIPSGLIIGRVFLKINLNEHGSKNIGASNAFRVMGIKLGLLTLFFDALKASVPVLFVKYLFPFLISGFNTDFTLFNNIFDYAIIYGLAAIFGHTFSMFLGFKGGKAVASSLGVVFTLTPYIGILALVVYFTTVFITKYASLGSTFAALAVGTGTFLQFYIQDVLVNQTFVLVVYFLMITFIIIKHIPNYKRLINKTESKLEFKKKDQPEQQ